MKKGHLETLSVLLEKFINLFIEYEVNMRTLKAK